METKAHSSRVKLPKGFKFSKELDGKFDNQPLFDEKLEKAKDLIRRAGLPDLDKYKK